MSSEDELRSAFQKELALISEYCSLKADAFDMRRKLDAEMALARAPVSSNTVGIPGAQDTAKAQQLSRTADAAAELLEKREKIRAEQEAELRRLREEILTEKQAPPFLATSRRYPSPHSTRSPSPGNRELSEDPSADETVVAPKAAPKGKGRPSGKGCPPPPPPASRESLPKGKGKGPPQGKGGKDRAEGEKTPGGTRLVNLHWRSSLEPEEAEVSVVEDTYLSGMVDMLPKQRHAAKQCSDNLSHFEKTMGIVDAFCLNSSADDRTPVCSPSPQPRDNDPLTPTFTPTHLETTPSAAITPAKNAAAQASPGTSNRRRRRNTIFSGDCAVRELPSDKLEEFFQVRPAAIDLFDKTQRSSMGTVRTLIRDTKHLQIIDILVKKEAIMSKQAQANCTRQQSEAAAVDALILALRRCDYMRCPPQALEDILKVTSAHGKETNQHNVLQFVDARGEEALHQLDHPQLHRLLYGILQIPAIDSRLECMVMEANSEESFKNCYSNLMTLGSGLMALKKIIEPLKYFCAAMKSLGNMLNQASNASASVSGYGVKMISIERFMQLKSPVRHEVNFFHLLVWNLPSDVLDKLIESSVMEDLNKAKLARSFTVHQLCTQFLDGFRQIQQLVETGKYKNCEIPIDSRPCSPEASAEGDIFFKNMRTFVETQKTHADQLALLCKEVFEMYRAFAAYIDDSKYFYPPPSDDSQTTEGGDTKRDLFEFFHWLLVNVKQTKDELVAMKLGMEHKRATSTTPVAKIEASDVVVGRRTEKHVASPVPEAKTATSLFTSSSMRALPRNASPPSQPVMTPEQQLRTGSPKPCKSPGRRDRVPSPSGRFGRRECNPTTDSQHASYMLEATSQLCPPPCRPVVNRLSLTEATIGASSRGLVLPGVQKVGTPTLQSSTTSGQSRESPTGSKSKSSDSGQASNAASPSSSPMNTTRKCRKSVTNLANKAERQGISRVLGETSAPIASSHASSVSSPSRSPSPSSDGGSEVDHASSVVGFAAEIREGARMRQGRFFRGQLALELPLGVDDEQEDSTQAWRTCRSPDARTPATSRYALSPVWEHGSETSHSLTPARRCRAYEHLSPVPLLQNFPECS